jgi:predicted small lipoprotein YifL
MRRTVAVAVLIGALALAGCGTKGGGSGPAAARAAASSAATAPPPVSAPAGDSGAWCQRLHGDRVSNAQRLVQTFLQSMPADQVESAFDELVREEQALAAVAPAQLAGDYRVIIDDLQQARAAVERAGWTPDAAREQILGFATNERHLQAVGDISQYADDHC